jgi:hypothetical protein
VLDFASDGRFSQALQAILPKDVIITMEAQLMPLADHLLQQFGGQLADNWRGQNRPAQERLQTIEAQRVGAPHFVQEAGLEDAPNRLAGVIGAKGDKEAGWHRMVSEERQQLGDTVL